MPPPSPPASKEPSTAAEQFIPPPPGQEAPPTWADKWELLPAFLEARGLVKQHIDSFNYFVTTEIKDIVLAESNRRITSDVDPNWFLEFHDVHVGAPSYRGVLQHVQTTPMMCRIRDMTYASDILVDISYVRGREVVRKNGVCVGRLPVMLRSKLCRLHDATTEQMERMQECPHDPGGYFIIKGTEKVLLMQEQLSNNRIIVEMDAKKMVQAVVTSSTADNKSRTVVCFKSELSGLFVKHSAFTELIPAVIMLRAMGMESDQEIVQMVGTEKCHVDGMILSLQDAHATGVFSQQQALEYLGNKLKIRSSAGTSPGSTDATERKMGEALEVLVRQVLSHISVYADGSFSSAFDQDKGGATKPLDFSGKCRFLCLMMRRALDARSDSTLLDDRDYYGNKRLELAGQLIALLFEDLFKSMNTEIKKSVDMRLTKYFQQTSSASARAGRSMVGPDSGYPDVLRDIDSERITRGMNRAISSGNWNIKRFRIDRSGVSQVLSRFSFIAALGAMTRVKSQFEKSR
ncbi:DNA-directed RNA polymerase III subunit RPC2, partial [Perkinsus olseni]